MLGWRLDIGRRRGCGDAKEGAAKRGGRVSEMLEGVPRIRLGSGMWLVAMVRRRAAGEDLCSGVGHSEGHQCNSPHDWQVSGSPLVKSSDDEMYSIGWYLFLSL